MIMSNIEQCWISNTRVFSLSRICSYYIVVLLF